jgi:HEPN domain-containing protein
MTSENFDSEKIIQYWLETSDKDFETMNHLFLSKDFHWCLFMGHLVLEKLLKAKVVKYSNSHAPFTHDLTRLASLSNIDFSDEQLDYLDTISTFNLNARYDSYKQAFYKKCTSDFTLEWFDKIKILQQWIKLQP